jgi:O-antigen/teichoic acid export membrane protein
LLAVGTLLTLLLWVGSHTFLPFFTGLQAPPDYYGWFCLYFLFYIPTFLTEYLYLVKQRTHALFWWGVFSFGTQLLFTFLPLAGGYGLGGAMAGSALWAALRLLWTLWVVQQYGSFQWIPSLLHEHFRFARPLILSMLTGNLILFFDNWLVGFHYQDAGIFALYRYGAREFPLATALTGALGSAMVLPLAHHLPSGLATLKAESTKLMHLLFPLTGALLLSATFFFPVVFNPDFKDAAFLFNIYLLITASRVLLPGSILLALGHPKPAFFVGLLELLVKIVTGFAFIQWWGLPGLAFSAVLSYWVEKAGLILYIEKRLFLKTSDWLPIRVYLLYVAALIGLFWVSLYS